jgi:hypothetical protein
MVLSWLPIYPSISDTIAWKRKPPLCHPARSVAQWRDLLCALT